MRKRHLVSVVMIVAAMAVMLAPAAVAKDKWKFGVGTGFFGLNIDGDAGFSTIRDFGPVTAGTPVLLDASLDSDEVRELMESAFGLGGFAAKDKWLIHFSVGQLELEDSLSGTTEGGTDVSATTTFTGSGAEVSAAYRFAVTGKHAWSVLGGLRHTKHEYDFGLTIGAVTGTRNLDHDWTDVLVGLTHGTQLSDKWTWGNNLNAGFGGSEGTYFFNTSFNWQFAKSWALGFYGKITSIEFENDDPGDPDYYLYDADEFGLGFNVLYTF
jgi:hypothetical protein